MRNGQQPHTSNEKVYIRPQSTGFKQETQSIFHAYQNPFSLKGGKLLTSLTFKGNRYRHRKKEKTERILSDW
ncbi:MAG: hypothetical protein QS748_06850 [Candidatus Endonucleobacter bathymodioli]|uniref:Uncharacterized protein n=1 Tax=Candidatus Endonucleibacter bathymodioli TaxID=539814 RepID=A0AA90NL25_9GAMM|nr:hypothetical protein [Candidatus Endonucleobacter bathymodioli]